MRLRLPIRATLLATAFLAASGPTHAQNVAATHAQILIAGLDFDDARRVLADAESEDPVVALDRARLAIYELDCDGAATILARPELQKSDTGEQLADIARGCQRVTAATAIDTDDARHIEVHWQDEQDRALAPILFETVALARDTLTHDLGVDWPMPTRIVVVRDLLSLSAMTGLPYESAQTTGTVAVAKWGRVTLLSPRASRHGYPWRDTIAHELTHLAVTRASRDRAPLWLQEGIAKREETRWREPGPFDDRPSPDAIVQRGFELGMGVPLDKLGPSIAMLPSADAAMVAFAEVTSFVRFYTHNAGEDALPKLLSEVRAAGDRAGDRANDDPLAAASGVDRKTWDARWRAYLASRPREPLPELFGLGPGPHSGREPLASGASKNGSGAQLGGNPPIKEMRDLRDRTRLAQLLMSRDRGYARAALLELDPIDAAPAAPRRRSSDPSVRWLRARVQEQVAEETVGVAQDAPDAGAASARGKLAELALIVGEPPEVLSSYGPWWAIRGRFARLRGDEATASSSFFEAVAADPLDPESACESVDETAPPAQSGELCAAALARKEPPFDGD
jgi:hypothetical protein